jgi:hypothetical protein
MNGQMPRRMQEISGELEQLLVDSGLRIQSSLPQDAAIEPAVMREKLRDSIECRFGQAQRLADIPHG